MQGLYVPTGMLGKKLAAAVVSPLPVTAFQAFQIVQDARVVLTGGIYNSAAFQELTALTSPCAIFNNRQLQRAGSSKMSARVILISVNTCRICYNGCNY